MWTQRTPMRQSAETAIPRKKVDWIEFWVRFACGAVLGMFLSVRLVFYFYYFCHPVIFVLGSVGIILGCSFAAARYGDRFWHSIFLR
jgi:hypothetical protein